MQAQAELFHICSYRSQVPLLTLDWLAFVLSKVLNRLAFCLSRLKVFRDWTVIFPAPCWLIWLRSKLVDVRDWTVLSPVSVLADRNWFVLPLSRLLTVFNWLLLPRSWVTGPPDGLALPVCWLFRVCSWLVLSLWGSLVWVELLLSVLIICILCLSLSRSRLVSLRTSPLLSLSRLVWISALLARASLSWLRYISIFPCRSWSSPSHILVWSLLPRGESTKPVEACVETGPPLTCRLIGGGEANLPKFSRPNPPSPSPGRPTMPGLPRTEAVCVRRR